MCAIYRDSRDSGWHVDGEDLICIIVLLLESYILLYLCGDVQEDVPGATRIDPQKKLCSHKMTSGRSSWSNSPG